MSRVEDIHEEVLNWAEEPDEKLLDYIGRRLADEEPLGFMGGGQPDQSSSVSIAERWLASNLPNVTEAYENKEGFEVELAVFLSNVLSSEFPAVPLGPLALIVARRIIERRPVARGRTEIEGVTHERSDPVSKDSNIERASLSPIFEGELNREAMSRALNQVLTKEGLSERQAAAKIGVNKNDVTRARNGSASIEKTSHILTELGYPPRLIIPE